MMLYTDELTFRLAKLAAAAVVYEQELTSPAPDLLLRNELRRKLSAEIAKFTPDEIEDLTRLAVRS